MTRHAAFQDDDAGSPRTTPLSTRERRAQARTLKSEERRLNEREQVSGEIRTPATITARRARRADKPQWSGAPPSKKTPVSARTMVPERTFSGRIIVLTIVTLVVISFLVPTVRTYLQQRAELNELAEQIAIEESHQAELYSDLARWDDPEFVRQQARERINLVMPGERRYHVIGDLADTSSTEFEEDEQSAGETNEWTDILWESVVESAEE